MACECRTSSNGAIKVLMIRATCPTVDDALTVEFDAAPWFQEADPVSVVQVAGQGWSSVWIADALEKRPGYERLHELIDYATNRLGQGTTVAHRTRDLGLINSAAKTMAEGRTTSLLI